MSQANLQLSTAPTTALQRLFSSTPGIVVLLSLVIFCYHKSATFEYIWDDDAYVVSNPNLDDLNGLSRIWTVIGATPQYYPVTFTSFWIERHIFGGGSDASRPAHIINLLLHAANSLLLFTILRRLMVPGAWLAAALFAVHPINIESVAWVAERKNTLSMFFGLSSLLVYLYYAGLIIREKPQVEPETSDSDGEPSELSEALPTDPSRLYFLFILFFILGLLSKTTVSVLPIVILIITWWKRGSIGKKDLLPLIFPIVLSVSAGLLTSYIERNPYLVGASGEDWERPIPDRIALVGQTTWFYICKLALPHPFILGHPKSLAIKDGTTFPLLLNLPESILPYLPGPLMFNYYKWKVDATQPMQWAGLVAMFAVLGSLFAMRKKLGRGAFACAICFCICLLPASGLFNYFPMQFSWVADHFVYIAAISFFILFAGISTAIWSRFDLSKRDIVGGIGASLIIGWLVWVSNKHIDTFEDPKHLWQNTLFRNDRSWMASGNLGSYWLSTAKQMMPQMIAAGKESESAAIVKDSMANASAWLNYASKINPEAYQVLYWQSQLAIEKGDFSKAFDLLNQSEQTAIKKGSKTWIYPRIGQADLLVKMGRIDEAEAIYESCKKDAALYGIRLPKTFARAYMALAKIHEDKISGPISKDMSQADRELLSKVIDEYTTAVYDIAPDWTLPKLQLARILIETGDSQAGLQLIGDVLKIEKQNVDAKYLSALAAVKLNEPQAAGAQLADLLKTFPEYWPAYPKFAEVLVMLNRKDEAIKELEYCISKNPNYAPAQRALNRLKAEPATQPVN